MTAPTVRHEPWVPGRMCSGVATLTPQGVTQRTAMFIIYRAIANGQVAVAMENIEVTISITDDAIYHMMRKR